MYETKSSIRASRISFFYLPISLLIGSIAFEEVQAAKDVCAGSKTESALLACRQKEFDKSESSMKSTIALLRTDYESEEPQLVKLLDDAQAKWQAYRDAECLVTTFESSLGTAYQAYKLSCLSKLNTKRLADLKAFQALP